MTKVANRAKPSGRDERAALQKSEQKASETEPGSYDEAAVTDTIVEVLPLGKDQAPIKGMDPKPAR